MACNTSIECSPYSIISERVTNLNADNADLVHCPICGYILWKPVACNLCENSFCFQCIQSWLFGQQEQNFNENENDYLRRCPFNCSPYQERKCPPLLFSILSKLTIECQNKSYGCQEILLYEQLEKHEEEFCRFKIVQCPGCKQHMFKEMFNHNEHLFKCLYIELECTKCQSIFKRKDQHNQFDCMEKRLYLSEENMFMIQERFSKTFDIQRKQIDILNQKINVIEDIWGNHGDDDEQIDRAMNPIPHWTQVFRLRSFGKWEIFIGIQLFIVILFSLFIYIRIFFS
jgi:hypothetical protein